MYDNPGEQHIPTELSPKKGTKHMISAQEALEKLREGNRRFVAGIRAQDTLANQARRAEVASGQQPFAIVLGCSDSRVPVEVIFDQGLGDLFVIRVAGNIAAPSGIGSAEFAAVEFGTRLVVVLGHSNCGAVKAALGALQNPDKAGNPTRNLLSIVDRVRPSVETVLADSGDCDHATLMHRSVRANVRASANHVRHGSPLMEDLIQNQGLLVVGAEYSLETGEIDFFDGV